MDRSAELIYLRDVRDLELALHEIKKRLRREKDRNALLYQRLSFPIEKKKTSSGVIGSKLGNVLWIVFFVSFIAWEVWVFVSDLLNDRPQNYTAYIYLFVGLIVFLVWGLVSSLNADTISAHRPNSPEKSPAAAALPLEMDTADAQTLLTRSRDRIEVLEKDFQWAKEVLETFYDMNLLPYEYRNLHSVFYIYEYMSLLVQSLESVLVMPQLDEGIERIERKMESVIRSQIHDIMDLRKQEISSPDMVEKQAALLMHLSQTELNPADSMRYAQLSVNSSTAHAFFKSVPYLLEQE
jgi:hypothetical protein